MRKEGDGRCCSHRLYLDQHCDEAGEGQSNSRLILGEMEIEMIAKRREREAVTVTADRYSSSFPSCAHLRSCWQSLPISLSPASQCAFLAPVLAIENTSPTTPSSRYLPSLPDKFPANTPSCERPDSAREPATTPRRIQLNSAPPDEQVLPNPRTTVNISLQDHGSKVAIRYTC